MKDKLPSYEFKVGEECWCYICGLFTEIAITGDHERDLPLFTKCSSSYAPPSRPLTLAEAKLLGLEPPRKTKTVTMWQAVLHFKLSEMYIITDELFLNESEASLYAANNYNRTKFIKLVNPIEVEVDE